MLTVDTDAGCPYDVLVNSTYTINYRTHPNYVNYRTLRVKHQPAGLDYAGLFYISDNVGVGYIESVAFVIYIYSLRRRRGACFMKHTAIETDR